MGKGLLLGLIASLIGCNSAPSHNSSCEQQDLEGKAEKFFAMCSDGEYDYDTRCIDYSTDPLGKINSSIYQIKISVTIEMMPNFEVPVIEGNCSSTLLEGGYVLTAGHCIKEESLLGQELFGFLQMVPDGAYNIEFKLKADEKEYGLEVISTGDNSDFGLLKLTEQADLPYLPISFGDADQLRQGNEIYLYGFIDDKKVNLRQGIVATLDPEDEEDGQIREGYFLIAWGQSGDSGGPVIAFRDGNPEVVGITGYIHGTQQESSAILKINRFIKDAGYILGITHPGGKPTGNI